MRISAGLDRAKAVHRVRSRMVSLASLTLAAVVAVSIAATPADARRRHYVRHSYSPPQSAMVLDANSGKILYSANIDEPRYPASITKVMTLYLVFEQLREGRIKPDTELKVSANAASQAPSKLDLAPGSTITVREAMYALVTKSANDVAVTFAENLAGSEAEFARAMTRKAHALGMNNTTYRNASGLPDSEQKTTARDLIILAQRILADFPDHASIFKTRVFSYGGEEHRNHNGLLFSYPGTEGMKTGYTQASGFNLLASVRRNDKHLLAVVLGGSSARDRNARMRNLLNQAWDKSVTLASLKAKGLSVATASMLMKRPAAAPAKPAAANEADTQAAAPKPQSGPVAEDFVISEEDMPEPNPAFHPTVAERTLAIAMASVTPGQRPAQVAQTQLALATETPEGANKPQAAKSGGETVAEGDAAATVAANADAPNALGPYHVQVGSYFSVAEAKGGLHTIHAKTSAIFDGHDELTIAGTVNGTARYRARFGQFSESEAKSACAKLKHLKIVCLVVRAE